MSHVAIIGGGSALAQPVIRHYLNQGAKITAVCRRTLPRIDLEFRETERLIVVNSLSHELVEPPFDVIITMTGVVSNARLTEMTGAAWLASINGNLTPVFEALRDGLPKMNDNGNVVVVGSIIGSTGGVGCANYAAAKAGLVGLVRAAANEVAARGICINLLELGYCDAGMGERLGSELKAKILPTIPLRRFAQPEEVVQAVDYLGRVRYMTGGILTLAGGMR